MKYCSPRSFLLFDAGTLRVFVARPQASGLAFAVFVPSDAWASRGTSGVENSLKVFGLAGLAGCRGWDDAEAAMTAPLE